MPPQGYVVLGGLAWNYLRSRQGKPTISMFCRRHKGETAVVLAGALAWFVPHIWLAAVEAIADAIDEATP